MKKVALILGSNIDNGVNYFEKARNMIASKVGIVEAVSSVYVSPAWGYDSQNDYKNQVLLVFSDKPAKMILEIILDIEKQMGRLRTPNSLEYEDRTLDIDILLIENCIINEKNLEVPHPRMHLRRFCLEPLNEICSNWIVPTFNISVQQLLQACEDKALVKKTD